MKILSLGLDNSALDKTSALARRVVEYGNLVERYDVIVPSAKNEKVELSEKVKVYASGGGNKLGWFFKICLMAKKLLREEKYNIITVQDQYYLALIGLRLSRKFKTGLEIQVHGFEKFYGLRRLIAGHVLPRANAVRAVSQRLKKLLISEFGVKEEKITVASIYSELRITNYELRIKKDTEKFIFLTVGRLVPVKNIGLQIKSMREVINKYPNTELWIVGDGPEFNNFKFKILNLKLEKNVKLLGWQDNLENYYNQSDASLLTSNSEGWGLAVIEAAQFGLPIIMTDVGCAGEVIKNEKSGLVIPVGDDKALEQAMEKIIENKNLRLALAAGAKEAVGRLPNQAETLKLYRESWQKALNMKRLYSMVQ